MSRSIVVAFRMSAAGMTPGPEGSYLDRARSLCVRGEGVSGSLVAWSAAAVALGWDIDSIDDAVTFAASIGDESLSPGRAWACGLAEGELESLSPDGQGILGWGPALLSATALAEVARAGEVLVDGAVRAVRAGQLSLLGVRVSADVAQSVRGWRLDLEQPWKRARLDDEVVLEASESADLLAAPQAHEESDPPARSSAIAREPLATRFRKLTHGVEGGAEIDSLAVLRRARAGAQGSSLSVRCRASLALALALSVAGRAEEALFEALEALARAREAHDAKAISACIALLAKLYAGAGHWDAATALRESVSAV